MKNKEKKTKKKMNGASGNSSTDELIAAEALLNLSVNRHTPLLEYLNDSESNWKRKRRRSSLDPIPLPLQPPAVAAAEKDTTTSPNTPFNFQTSDEELMMHSSPKKKRGRGRMDVGIGSTPLIAEEETQAVGPIMAHPSNGPVTVGPIGFDLNELPAEEEEGEPLVVIGDRGTRCAAARNGVVVQSKGN